MRTLTLMLALTTGCVVHTGDGDLATEVRQVPSFDGVANHTRVDVTVVSEPGVAQEVVVSCDRNLLQHIETEVVDGVLVLSTDVHASIDPRAECMAEVSTDTLFDLVNAGSGRLVVDGELDRLDEVRGSGSGDTIVRGIDATVLEARNSGSGDITLVGEAAMLELKLSGSGDVMAQDLTADDVDVRVSGSGDAWVHAERRATVSITGSGDVHLSGRPESVDQTTTGSGELYLR